MCLQAEGWVSEVWLLASSRLQASFQGMLTLPACVQILSTVYCASKLASKSTADCKSPVCIAGKHVDEDHQLVPLMYSSCKCMQDLQGALLCSSMQTISDVNYIVTFGQYRSCLTCIMPQYVWCSCNDTVWTLTPSLIFSHNGLCLVVNTAYLS